MPRRFSSARRSAIGAGEGFDESGFAVIDVAGGADDDVSHCAVLMVSAARRCGRSGGHVQDRRGNGSATAFVFDARSAGARGVAGVLVCRSRGGGGAIYKTNSAAAGGCRIVTERTALAWLAWRGFCLPVLMRPSRVSRPLAFREAEALLVLNGDGGDDLFGVGEVRGREARRFAHGWCTAVWSLEVGHGASQDVVGLGAGGVNGGLFARGECGGGVLFEDPAAAKTPCGDMISVAKVSSRTLRGRVVS